MKIKRQLQLMDILNDTLITLQLVRECDFEESNSSNRTDRFVAM